MNSLECVKYVCGVGVVSEVESHICWCPSVRATRLNELTEREQQRRCYITESHEQTFNLDIEWGKKRVQTFSTRSMKKSLTSFVLVNFAAMLTRPLERFCKKRKKDEIKLLTPIFSHPFLLSYLLLLLLTILVYLGFNEGAVFFTLKLASISVKAFVFPLRAVQTRLSREWKHRL